MYKYGRKREHRGHKRWTKKLTIRTIIGTFKHEEVALAQTKGKIGTYQSALSHVQEQLTEAEEKTYQEILEAWEKDGIPEEKQREIAIRHATGYIREFTREMLEMCGISCVVLTSSVKKGGERVTCLNDYLTEYGGRGLTQAVPDYLNKTFERVMNEWEFSFSQPPPPKMLKGHPRITVEIKDKENITYPEYDPTWHSETKKTLVRDIVNASYATEIAVGSSKVISWKALSAAENQGRFIDPECLPENFQWQDPSHLAVTDVEALLGHWENRRSEGLKALIFTEVLHNGNLVSVDELPELLAVSKSRRKGVKSRYRAVEEARGTDENREETEDTPEATEVVHSPRKLRARKGSRKGNNYDDILGPLSDEESGEDSEAYNEDGKKGDGEDDSEDTDEDDTEVRPRTEDIPTSTPTSKLKWRPLEECIWGHGQEKVVTSDHLFPIPNPPPSTASRSATTSMRKDFVRKLLPNDGYREAINILEVLGIEPPPRMLHTAAGAPWISWKFDEPWIPEAWWREPGSIEGIRQWFQTTPFVLNNGDLAAAGVWSGLFTAGMITREVWLARSSVKYTELGKHFPPCVDILSRDQMDDWMQLMRVHIENMTYIVKMRAPPPTHPLSWVPARPCECGNRAIQKAEFLKTLHGNRRFQKIVSLLLELPDDFVDPDTPPSDLRPEWATWYFRGPWLCREFFHEEKYVEEVAEWFSSVTETEEGHFIGVTRMTEVLLAWGMIFRQVHMVEVAEADLGEYSSETWTTEALGHRFPARMQMSFSEEVDEPLRALAGLLSGWLKVVEAEVELQKAMDELMAKTVPLPRPRTTRPLLSLSQPVIPRTDDTSTSASTCGPYSSAAWKQWSPTCQPFSAATSAHTDIGASCLKLGGSTTAVTILHNAWYPCDIPCKYESALGNNDSSSPSPERQGNPWKTGGQYYRKEGGFRVISRGGSTPQEESKDRGAVINFGCSEI
ncbi:hypothetical protein DENSPDRAFT_852225 [Dentipellis sp. KUC8613]|nr:hypothetical protein DENSPDRAFT_852225 [Dentipellis sp. KUC8613]